MYPFNFISVGIDVGADFSWMAVLTPNHKSVVKPFKIIQNDLGSLEKAVSTIKRVEEANSMEARIFLESTGIYHIPLFYYLKNAGLKVYILNPLITNSNKNSGIRKVKSDKKDAIRIAKTAYTDNLKTSLVPSDLVLSLRSLVREYYYFVDHRTAFINKLHKELRIVFPSYIGVFSDITGKTSLAVLKTYKTPNQILNAPKQEVIHLITKISRSGLPFATKKYDALFQAATCAMSFGKHLDASMDILQMNIQMIEQYNHMIDSILTKIEDFIAKHEDELFVQQIHILDSINGIGFISAVTLMCEIGEFSAFSKPKQLFAYFGLDPAVNESGKFKGTHVKMSKRGSRLARRILYHVTLSSVGTVKGKPVNPVLKEYYEKKKQSKPNKVALGAVMHKIVNIIYAVLRDHKLFELVTVEDHCKRYKKYQLTSAA